MYYNYKRTIPPVQTGVYVARIVKPLKLPQHTKVVFMWSQLRFQAYEVSEQKVKIGLWRYCVRLHNDARIIPAPIPPHLLGE